jgi:hypothetical protein
MVFSSSLMPLQPRRGRRVIAQVESSRQSERDEDFGVQERDDLRDPIAAQGQHVQAAGDPRLARPFAHARVAERALRVLLAGVATAERAAGPLQRAGDRRHGRVEHGRRLLGRERQYLAEQQRGPLPGGEVL